MIIFFSFFSKVYSKEVFLECFPTKGTAYKIDESKWIPFKSTQTGIYKLDEKKKIIYKFINNKLIKIGHSSTKWGKDTITFYDDFTEMDDTKVWGILNRYTGELHIKEVNGSNSFSQKDLNISMSDQFWNCNKIDRKF